MNSTRIRTNLAGKGFLLLYAVFIAFPVLWAVNTAFKPIGEVHNFPPVWISSEYTLKPFIAVIENPKVYSSFIDSFIIASGSTVISVALGTLAGYGFSRYPRYTKGEFGPFFLLALSMLPAVTLVLPFFFIWSSLGLLDTHLGIIIVYLSFSLPFAAWLMRDYFDNIPLSYEEAARTDGYTQFQTLQKVVLPLVMPGLFAVTVITFIFGWTEFLYAFVLGGKNITTYTALFPDFVAGRQVLWNQRMALALIAIMPPILLMLVLRDRVTELF
jgi:ABC-type glycerol-3-phosphate transport system permease component